MLLMLKAKAIEIDQNKTDDIILTTVFLTFEKVFRRIVITNQTSTYIFTNRKNVPK